MSSGIYQIINTINTIDTINSKRYIGSSINIDRRFRIHKSLLNRNMHENKHLQRSWNTYGSENFGFDVIEFVSSENLISKEKEYIDNSILSEYNVQDPIKGTLDISRKFYHPYNKKHISKSYQNFHNEQISKTLREKCSGSRTKLNWNIVREIRNIISNSDINYSTLGRKFNVDRSQISRIANNVTWREVNV